MRQGKKDAARRLLAKIVGFQPDYKDALRYLFTRRCLLTTAAAQVGVFARTRPGLAQPDGECGRDESGWRQ